MLIKKLIQGIFKDLAEDLTNTFTEQLAIA